MEQKPHSYGQEEQYTYISGLGFLPQTPKQKELRQLHISYNVVLFSILLLFFLRVSSPLPILRLMSYLGFNVSVNPMTSLVIHSETAYQVGNILVYAVQMLIPAGVIWLFLHREISPHKLWQAPAKGTTAAGVCMLAGVAVLAQCVALLCMKVLHLGGMIISWVPEEPPQGLWPFTLYIFSLTLLPAVLEEFLFHGMILRAFRRFGDITALFVSSVMMTLVQTSADWMIYTMIMSLALGYFALKTKSVFVPIAGSFIARGSFITFYLLQRSDDFASMQWICLAVWMILLTLSLLAFCWMISRDQKAFCLFRGDSYLTNRTKLKALLTNVVFWMIVLLAFLTIIRYLQIID